LVFVLLGSATKVTWKNAVSVFSRPLKAQPSFSRHDFILDLHIFDSLDPLFEDGRITGKVICQSALRCLFFGGSLREVCEGLAALEFGVLDHAYHVVSDGFLMYVGI
jgi:hypothetical protein